MRSHKPHPETHQIGRIGWLRAAVLGANDGIVSTASLIVGVASAHGTRENIMVAGVAGLVAGAMSMAAGEYVSVSSQADTEQAALTKEREELATDPKGELEELTGLFKNRGLTAKLAKEVAEQLTDINALEAHAREELGISEITVARPLQAASSSAVTFAVGAALPLALAALVSLENLIIATSIGSLLFLGLLGGLAARTGGAVIWKGVLRVTFWGALAMGLTSAIGSFFGTSVS